MIKKQNVIKTVYRTANLLLPLWEGKSVLKAVRYTLQKRAESAATLRLLKEEDTATELTFEEAVRQSGLTRPALMKRYLLRKRAWLMLMAIPVLIIAVLIVSLVATDIPLTGLMLLRPFSLLFMLLGFTGVLLTQALVCQFRLWQLQSGQLGSFITWRRSGSRLKDTLRWDGGVVTAGNTGSVSET